jgi:hypothetical protein
VASCLGDKTLGKIRTLEKERVRHPGFDGKTQVQEANVGHPKDARPYRAGLGERFGEFVRQRGRRTKG